MLKNGITTQGDAVETHFCQPFEKLQRVPMTQELSEIMIRLLFAKDFKIPEKEKPFLFQVIEKRIQHSFTFSADEDRLTLFLCALTESPGKAVMYLTYLQYWCKKNDVRSIDLDVLCERIFPTGFPKDSELSDLWDKVKVTREGGSDNLLDYQSAMTSIQFE